jgi:glycosyltransferase involved in cell wall biosynthesis
MRPVKAMLRVGFDALFFEQPMTGSGQYATQLWPRLAASFPDIEMLALAPSDTSGEAAALAGGRARRAAMPRLSRRPRKVYWEQVAQPRLAGAERPDLVHVPYFAAPLVQRVPYVVTIHDVIPLVAPVYRGSRAMRGYLRVVSRTVRKARLILTDSDYSRREIACTLGIPLDRIVAIPLAASATFRPPDDSERAHARARLEARFGLNQDFIFNVGGFDVRKRLDVLIEAFAMASPALPEGTLLVIAGSPHTGNPSLYPPLEPLMRRHGLGDRVRLVGFVSEDEKRSLFWAAAAYAYTSEYEGFGLSPLEALSCGTPVVCSNRTSLPEVVGTAGLQVEPTPRAVAASLTRLMTDGDLREHLSLAGPAQAARFSWERTAMATASAYRRTLGHMDLRP